MDQLEDRNGSPKRPEPLANCFWCGRPHPGDHPLSVCPACVAKMTNLRSLEMRGCYPLEDAVIDEQLTYTSPGNYALGYMEGGTFTVFYVGRSDSDLRQRLHEWVGMPSRDRRYLSLAKASWGIQRRRRVPVGTPALDRVGSAQSSYTHFAYSYAPSADEAYAKEWRNYDAFGGSRGLDNENRPVSGTEDAARVRLPDSPVFERHSSEAGTAKAPTHSQGPSRAR